MKTRLIAVLAIVAALVLGGSPLAAAGPYRSQTKSVTYSISLISGQPVTTMIYYQSSSGMTWDMTDDIPWSATFRLPESAAPNVYFYAMVGWTQAPQYACSITVNGKLVVKRTVEAHQCLQSYPGQVSLQ